MLILLAPCELHEEVKKSRFICRAAPAASAVQALAFLEQVSERRATHNCWAYRVGDQARCSDDGEPGGTAGRPIQGAIDKQQVDRVVLVVTRYFGGIKLGAGGLVRAYGGVAARCLQQGRLQELPRLARRKLRVPLAYLGLVRALLGRHQATLISEVYDAAEATLCLELEADAVEPMEQALADATAGQVVVGPA